MRGRAALLVVTIVVLTGGPAGAREPLENDRLDPPRPAPRPDPVAFVVPDGLYYVTDTYVGDVVATNGATTTYATTTVHESTGTYARVIDTVGTGASSAFDGLAFNGRRALTDGRALAGTYYENFVLTGDGYVPVSIVFFQDDSETRRHEARPSSSPVATAVPPMPTPALGSVVVRGDATPAPPFRPTPTARARPTPAGPAARARPTPAAPDRLIPVAPAPLSLQAGIALAPDGPTLASAEVLRGRLIRFWPRAFANGVAVPLRSWRLLSAEPDRISARSGSAEPFAAQWLKMPAPAVRWTLRFEMFTELSPAERLEAQISIAVRSPALID